MHEHYIGRLVVEKMAELDDVPATCEKYPFPGEQESEVSLTWGVSGMLYVYIKQLDRVMVYPTFEMMVAGGVI